VEINHQLSWLHPDRHHVRLMLPQSTPDSQVARRRAELAWLHTTESTGELYRQVESGAATIQKVTIAKRGGRWQVSFMVRYKQAPAQRPVRRRGGLVGVDAGVRHLVTTSVPVPGLALDPYFPSSKTCSNCDHAKAKLALCERLFRCDHCGLVADRDVNAARTIRNEAQRLLHQEAEQDQQSVAGLRPETQNADRRRRKTREAQADLAAVA
jgi:transposase